MTKNEEIEKPKIADLDLSDADKMILSLAATPRTLAFFAMKLNSGYSTVSQ